MGAIWDSGSLTCRVDQSGTGVLVLDISRQFSLNNAVVPAVTGASPKVII